MRIDHVILAVSDLEEDAARLRDEYGLASAPGGIHAQWGTANRIVPLGGQYLEIIAVTDPSVAGSNPFGRWVAAASAQGARLAGLMVEPDDFDATCARLSLMPTDGQRARPDGGMSTWRLAGVGEAITRTVPCFISWDDRDALFEGDAGVGATGFARLELGGDVYELAAWLGRPVDALRAVGGEPGLRSLTISTSGGDIVIPQHPFG